jgi:4a-hydroxytetrahydrobiopterin dehydratase
VDLVCLTNDQYANQLSTIPDWTLVKNSVTGDSIQRSFEFNDFQEAFLFMSSVAQLAETNQHHPDWHNLWNTVDITLTTDDKACLSTFDVEFAQGIDLLLKSNGNKFHLKTTQKKEA